MERHLAISWAPRLQRDLLGNRYVDLTGTERYDHAMKRAALITVIVLLAAALGATVWATTRHGRPAVTRDEVVAVMPARVETAVFGAGCFWRVEAVFRKVPGVVATASGFTGGTTDRPTYRDVSLGGTGHAEVVRVTYDPVKVTYPQLLATFFDAHDATKPHDDGPHQSLIFCADDAQRDAAAKAIAENPGAVTRVRPLTTFWRAEDYHQQYLEKHGRACLIK